MVTETASSTYLREHGQSGAVLSSKARKQRLRISAATLDFLRRIGREALPAAGERPPGEAVLRQVEDLCAQVRRGFLQRELRSYDVIRKTLARL